MSSYHTVVIGGGINGCSTAFHLAQKGKQVLLLERSTIGSEASSAAAGMLGAQVEINSQGAFFDFARASRSMYDELVPKLESYSGIHVDYIKNGMLKTAHSDEEASHLLDVLAFQQAAGEKVSWLTREELQKKESNLADETVQGALYMPEDGQVMAPYLTKAYAGSAAFLGAEIMERTLVSSIKRKTNGYEVASSRGIIEAEHVVMAGGAWTDLIDGDIGVMPEMIPVKGDILSIRPAEQFITSTIHAPDVYLVPKKNGTVIVGATEHPGSMESRVYAGSIHDLLKSAFTLVPDLAGAEFKQAWSGIRPQSADDLPYLGSVDNQGLWMAAGHYRNGILLSAGTGDWLARSICGEPVNAEWEKAFSPRRKRIKEGVSSEAYH